ncbi:glutathione-regulated potassium-efflux system protein KefC [Thraustotheca clavata]|uniref:Glutathione-regulated potassium-efflux system protein KefC n=1 Tax=Thraustotheca clavata TaxID=74557 RepID=A0A1V9YXZ4_9STRA|nr:glutathione-regulated potassium-efflux system protein KefC [Thraustotheca clavata]
MERSCVGRLFLWICAVWPAVTALMDSEIDVSCTPLTKSQASPSKNYCGVDMRLAFKVPVALDNDITPENLSSTCYLNEIALPNTTLARIDEKWTLQVGYTVQLGDPDSEFDATRIQCQVKQQNETIAQVSETIPIAIYAYPPEIDGVQLADPTANSATTPMPTPEKQLPQGTSHVQSVNAIGIGKTVQINLITKSNHVVAGTCMLFPLGHTIDIQQSQGTYVIAEGDPSIPVGGMSYQCNVTDDAGNPANARGVVNSENIALDGTIPRISGVFMVFSSEIPAKIGSLVTITLQAANRTTGYTGNCSVNGVGDLELLETSDGRSGLYMVKYLVEAGDKDIPINGTLPFECHLTNPAGNKFLFADSPKLQFPIDANRPTITATSLLFSSDDPAHEDSVIEVQIRTSHEDVPLTVHKDRCEINNVTVAKTFTKSSQDTYLLTYVVGKGQAMWKPGKLPISCTLQDAGGNAVMVEKFTDDNTLFARELKPYEFDPTKDFGSYLPDRLTLLSFIIVAIASHTIANFCPVLGLPRITGYLATGIITGPYVLGLITANETLQMRFVDEASLAYIGLAAGAKLHWSEMRRKLKSIMCVTLWLTVFEYIVGTLTMIVLANYLVFLQSTTSTERYAISMLAGCMMIARSPSSALAVIEETGSQGHFTTFMFSVTVVCDIVVIVLFNVNNMITEAFLSDKSVSSTSVLELIGEMGISIAVGIAAGKIISYVILWRTPRIRRKSRLFVLLGIAKEVVILLFGFSLFVLGHLCRPWLEPLMCCMVAGATLYNWNPTTNREELSMLLKNMADFVYVGFFTLTGASLELDMLVKALAVSICLCLTRIFAIFLGAYVGGTIAKEDPVHNKVSWMAYITQAGVTLGLAKKIQLLYPGWGSYFATMIVSVVICNQLIGPPLLRMVLRYVGDCRQKENGKVDGLRSLIIGDEKRSVVVNSAKRRMKNCGWEPFSFCMAMQDAEDAVEMNTQLKEALKIHEPLDVVVVMMSSDVLNFRVVRSLAHICTKLKRIKILRIVVNVVGDDGEAGWASRFASMPTHEEHGDAIDVVVVDRHEATDMLIELAACGKLINQKEVLSPRADTQEDEEEEEECNVKIKVSLSTKMRQMMWV